MPHLLIDCSRPVLELADADALMAAVYEAAASTGLFADHGVGGIKVRLRPFDHCRNVDGHERFVHVFAFIMEGRAAEQKAALAEAVVRALAGLLPSVEIISVNVSEFERATYRNRPLLGVETPEDGEADGPTATDRV